MNFRRLLSPQVRISYSVSSILVFPPSSSLPFPTRPLDIVAFRPLSLIALVMQSRAIFISRKAVVPVFIISRQASCVPQYISSAVSLSSIGIILSNSQVWNIRSSALFLKSDIQLCVWLFTSPAVMSLSLPSIVLSGTKPFFTASSPIQEITLSLTAISHTFAENPLSSSGRIAVIPLNNVFI